MNGGVFTVGVAIAFVVVVLVRVLVVLVVLVVVKIYVGVAVAIVVGMLYLLPVWMFVPDYHLPAAGVCNDGCGRGDDYGSGVAGCHSGS